MSYKSLDPIADHEKHDIAETLRASRQVMTLKIRGLLRKPVDLQGYDLDADVTAEITRIGLQPELYVELDYDTIWLVSDAVEGGAIDITETISKSLKADFELRLIELAKARANSTPDFEWDVEEKD